MLTQLPFGPMTDRPRRYDTLETWERFFGRAGGASFLDDAQRGSVRRETNRSDEAEGRDPDEGLGFEEQWRIFRRSADCRRYRPPAAIEVVIGKS
jgi:hypothetical protein